jgi:UDP-2,3-diacylglucosamine pyrophosphatase LpxH
MEILMAFQPLRLRSLFISDLHLGKRGANVEALLDFLASVHPERLFLVGDVIDLESLGRRYYWPPSHSAALAAILRKARAGTRVIFIPGNHDVALRDFDGARLANVEFHRKFLHFTAAGRRLLVMHGDEFDAAIACHPLLARLGDGIYEWLLQANRALNGLRSRLALPPWSLVSAVKLRFGRARRYMEQFERAAVDFARARGVDGIVCGHIHRAAVREVDGIHYCNSGDWVESSTAVAENFDGTLHLVRWPAGGHRTATSRSRIRHTGGARWAPGT